MGYDYNGPISFIFEVYLYLGGLWIVLGDSYNGGVHPRHGRVPSAIEVVFWNGWTQATCLRGRHNLATS